MTLTQFASLGQSAFNVMASKRQKHIAACKVTNDLLDKDPCDRGCHCAMEPQIKAAKVAEGSAYADLREAEDSYREYTKIRYDR